jgi:hypothetical protein
LGDSLLQYNENGDCINQMPLAISPRHTTDDFKDHWNLEDKIEVFIARVEGWQLGVAAEMATRQIPDRDLAVLHIVTSFFEMFSKYYSGSLDRTNSRQHFKRGVRLAFPAVAPEEQTFLDSLYDHVRNGIYHVARPASNVIIAKDAPGSIGYNAESGMIMLNPDILVEDLRICFASYAETLRDPRQLQLRSNFQRRFDADNHPVSPPKSA